ncbi:MAG: hypothetical protein U0X20_12875 [Caldilineaceae bacterium]
MATVLFEHGAVYTRLQIHDVLGGGVQSYLPRRDGRVVCGCFTQTLNPTAPDVVLVGNRPHVIRDAKLFAAQRYPVPIFIKQGINRWEYVGNYMVERYSIDPGELQSLRKKAARPHAVGALFLKKVE